MSHNLASRSDFRSQSMYEEQKKVLGNPDGTFRPVTYESTKQMPLLDSAIRETLRLVSTRGVMQG